MDDVIFSQESSILSFSFKLIPVKVRKIKFIHKIFNPVSYCDARLPCNGWLHCSFPSKKQTEVWPKNSYSYNGSSRLEKVNYFPQPGVESNLHTHSTYSSLGIRVFHLEERLNFYLVGRDR